MIDRAASRLKTSYLTVLEIGGAYAHRFDELLAFLHIPYIIVTDLDSVHPDGHHPACRADTAGALTSNATLKHLLGLNSIAELIAATPQQKTDEERDRYITFQKDIVVTDGDDTLTMRPRTLEEAFAYENFPLLRDGTLNLRFAVPAGLDDAYEAIYDRIKSSSFKKTDFAMDMLSSDTVWKVPEYISDGLRWLETRLHGPVNDEPA
ncbi:TOPRIM nucleotidyl transferase/hydrolase domain-containing protein [Parasphingorhabdus halotolerans]|uniref:TOPRIM nucleotidyl transferase/hydrolase domain-containing protein n=1 Tax=Parasphingorhabdus halotolerans TaxID=2725558 RepID=UPI001B3A524A|nr:TOPRIM nucleotidyl transferase/hydrolase domain-containing protein [Parasphingorhabdus halotolerans]